MPEVHFEVRWPDGVQRTYYSPSTAIHQHLRTGESYRVPEFLVKARVALHEASERVRAKYGFTCSSAMDTLSQIEEMAKGFEASADAEIAVVAMNGRIAGVVCVEP